MNLRSPFLAPFLLLALLIFAASAPAATPPNIIVCIADDISYEDFACNGSTTARTPRIDQLAGKGMRFTEACLTASSCSPSRSSIITGRYPHNLGRAAELHEPIAAHLPWVPGLLRQAGYHTALVGKNHMTTDKLQPGDPTPPQAWDLIDDGKPLGDRWVATIEKRPKDKPFFFWFAAHDAHRAWDADNDWIEAKYGPKHDPKNITVPPFLVDDDPTRQDLASYHNEVTRFDYCVGQVADSLTAQGLLENTLILILADNGRPFPRAKTRLHDSGMKTALIAHWPAGITKSGATCTSLVSVIDFAPTFLELAGAPPAPTFQGLSIAPLFRDPTAVVRRHAFSEHNWHDYEAHGRAVRSGGFLYIRNARPALPWQGPADSVRSPSHQSLLAARAANTLTPAQADVFLAPRPVEELYLTASDPNQLHNLAGDPAHAEAKNRLSALLDQWTTETGDAAPANLTPDSFDRETGAPTGGKRPDRRDYPGLPHKADRINHPGPH